jgi:hypothetical protein
VLGGIGLFAGCNSPATDKVPVSGTVTFSGQPVPTGDIVFIAADGATASDSGRITDGKFNFQTKPGKKRVEINATRAGKVDPVMGPSQEPYIPAKYNSQSTLTVEVVRDKENNFPLELTP